ncbi:MAG: hypothetical protein IKL97_06080, partial [Eggerthellaceae bacterium]|nr:hypothetical protein [Eggerthellaceae bacterium]
MSATKRGNIAIIVGLMAYCAMLRTPFIGTLISVNIESFALLRFAYDASLTVVGLVLALKVLEGALDRLSGKRDALAAVSGALTALGVLALVAGRALEGAVVALGLCGVLAISLGFVGLTLAWFAVLLVYPRDRIVEVVIKAFFYSHLFFVVDMLPRSAAAAVSVLYPVASSAALLAALKQSAGESASDEVPFVKEVRHSDYFKRMRVFALVLIMVEVLCGALLRSRWAMGGVGYDPTANTAFTYMASAATALVFLLIAKKAHSASEGALIIGGIGLVGFSVAAALFSVLTASLMAPFVTGLYSALLVFVMALLVLWGADGDHRSGRAAGVFLAFYGLVSVVTTTVVPTILRYQGIMPDEHLVPVGVLAGLVASLGVVAVLFFMVVIHRGSYLKALEEVASSLGPLFAEEYLAADVSPAF